MSYPDSHPGANPTSSKGPTPHLEGGEGGLQGRANKMHAELEKKRDEISPNVLNWQGGREGDVAQFPAKYVPVDHDADTRMQMKKELIASQALGQGFITDEDMKYLLNKRKIQDRVIFDAWYSKLWDTKDINKLRLAQQIYPDYFKDREGEINREAELQKKIAMIKLRGPADLDDLKLIFQLSQGQEQLRNVPLWRLDEPPEDTASQYRRGIFNPARFLGDLAGNYVPRRTGHNIFTPTGGVDERNVGGFGVVGDAGVLDRRRWGTFSGLFA